MHLRRLPARSDDGSWLGLSIDAPMRSLYAARQCSKKMGGEASSLRDESNLSRAV